MSLTGPNVNAFLSVHRLKTVTGAAGELCISQAAVTQRIHSLENELGVTLFLRSRKGMELTREGRLLLRHCEVLQASENELLSNLEGSQNRPIQISISAAASIMRWRVVPQLVTLIADYPWLRFNLDFSESLLSIDALRLGKTQLAVVPQSEVTGELDSKIIAPQRFYVIVPDAWKNREFKDIVENETVIGYDEKGSTINDCIKKYGLNASATALRHFLNNNEAIAEFVRAGLGYSIATQEQIEKFGKESGVTRFHPEKYFEYDIALAWYRRDPMPGYFRDIIRVIK